MEKPKDRQSRKELIDDIIHTATNYKTSTGGRLQFIVVPRADFLQFIKERDARRRCAAVLKKTHKELKRLRRLNSWNQDKGGRWTNPSGSLIQDVTRATFLALLEVRMADETYGFVKLLSKDTFIKITERYTRRLENLLDAANKEHPAVRSARGYDRKSACERYLRIWKDAWSQLSLSSFKHEHFSQELLWALGDALASGDCDDLITPEEKTALDKFFGDA